MTLEELADIQLVTSLSPEEKVNLDNFVRYANRILREGMRHYLFRPEEHKDKVDWHKEGF